jgi:23S rRNA pseudouridine1911/1915/1917 synthase
MAETLLDWLVRRYPTAKRETLRQMVRDGRVTVNGATPRGVKGEIAASDRVEVADRRPERIDRSRRAASSRLLRRRLPFAMVYEDADLLVVDKPPGLLTSTVPGERRPTLLAAVQEYVESQRGTDRRTRVGLIHRLDRDASGLLVFSRNDSAYHSLKSQLFHRKIEREYLAVTQGVPTPREGRIESRLEERADGTVYATRAPGQGERAATHYEVVQTFGGGGGGGGRSGKQALVRVRLETGRKHQIRVHLAQRGAAIVGDPVYGKDETTEPRLMLAAVKLGFTHPRTGKPVAFELPPPAGFEK